MTNCRPGKRTVIRLANLFAACISIYLSIYFSFTHTHNYKSIQLIDRIIHKGKPNLPNTLLQTCYISIKIIIIIITSISHLVCPPSSGPFAAPCYHWTSGLSIPLFVGIFLDLLAIALEQMDLRRRRMAIKRKHKPLHTLQMLPLVASSLSLPLKLELNYFSCPKFLHL